jgi:hypothetical protein
MSQAQAGGELKILWPIVRLSIASALTTTPLLLYNLCHRVIS